MSSNHTSASSRSTAIMTSACQYVGQVATTKSNKSRRSKKRADIVTGSTSTREQVAMIRPPKECKAMGRINRRRLESKGFVTRSCWNACHACMNFRGWFGGEDIVERNMRPLFNNEDDDGDGKERKTQYTLESRKVNPYKSIFPLQRLRQQFCFCCSRGSLTTDEFHPDGTKSHLLFVDVNSAISGFLSWSFRTSYFLLFVAFAGFYYILILFWAVIYWGVAVNVPECIASAGNIVGTGVKASIWSDCFQLSWTTLSTVGYGIVFPATGASGWFVPHHCQAVGIFGSVEAFLGVLYAGFCGAILFGKVSRAQSRAQVLFSDPIVVRFGTDELTGSSSSSNNNDSKQDEAHHGGEEEKAKQQQSVDEEMGAGNNLSVIDEKKLHTSIEEKNNCIPCPSLEFRLMNRLHEVNAGEIVEAQLKCVAILDPKLCQRDLMDSIAPKCDDPPQSVHVQNTIGELARVLQEKEHSGETPSHRRTSFVFHATESKQPRVFCKLELDSQEHPFFRRVWFGRHRLDENSPLLTQAAKECVKANGGYWPAEMNNYRAIKKSLHFRHIMVCLSGTSNANAASVYAQKVYDLVDVNVGYRFVPMNYHNETGLLKTDPYLLNAVYQQRGGGAEPFN